MRTFRGIMYLFLSIIVGLVGIQTVAHFGANFDMNITTFVTTLGWKGLLITALVYLIAISLFVFAVKCFKKAENTNKRPKIIIGNIYKQIILGLIIAGIVYGMLTMVNPVELVMLGSTKLVIATVLTILAVLTLFAYEFTANIMYAVRTKVRKVKVTKNKVKPVKEVKPTKPNTKKGIEQSKNSQLKKDEDLNIPDVFRRK